jgi:hypothetical protein
MFSASWLRVSDHIAHNELADGGDGVLEPRIGPVQDRNSISVEYAGWVRIVET